MIRKILFLGNYGNRNVGDNAILIELVKRYKKTFPKSRIYIICRENIDDINLSKSVFPVRMVIREMKSAFYGSDLVVIGGGGIFSEYVGPRARFIPFVAILAKILGKKVYFESLGFYPSTSPLLKFLVRVAFLFSDKISVRDGVSIQTAGWVNSIKRIELVEDPAVSLVSASGRHVHDILINEGMKIGKGTKLIGVSIKRVKNPKYAARVTKVFKKLIQIYEKNKKIAFLFIPYSRDRGGLTKREDDYSYNEELLRNFNNNPRVFLLKREYSPNEILGITRVLNLSICMRFHSIVFAYMSKIPFVPISYAEKCQAYLEKKKINALQINTLTYNKVIHFNENVEHILTQNKRKN
jgi:polysaccharide pyruvyl transferase WcaK-like protein